MATRITTVTRKGQLTIPVEFRRALGIEPGDQISVEQQDDTVVLRRTGAVSARTAGALSAYRHSTPLTPKQEREAFQQAVADKQAHESSETHHQ